MIWPSHTASVQMFSYNNLNLSWRLLRPFAVFRQYRFVRNNIRMYSMLFLNFVCCGWIDYKIHKELLVLMSHLNATSSEIIFLWMNEVIDITFIYGHLLQTRRCSRLFSQERTTFTSRLSVHKFSHTFPNSSVDVFAHFYSRLNSVIYAKRRLLFFLAKQSRNEVIKRRRLCVNLIP